MEAGVRPYLYVVDDNADEDFCQTLVFPHKYYRWDDVKDTDDHVEKLLHSFADGNF